MIICSKIFNLFIYYIMKILHLVLYSKSDYYDQMKIITNNFYKIFKKNVDTYYYYYDESIKENFQLVNNELKIKGKETFIPGILQKTILAFKYFENKLDNYDYVIRSNISTIIDFDKIIKILLKNRYDYGCYLFIRPSYKFSSGTSILVNNKLIRFILDSTEKIDYTKIDDVAIGILIFTHFKENIKFCDLKKYICFDWKKNNNNKQFFIFRNKIKKNRFIDVSNMNTIIDFIKKSKKKENTKNITNKKINKKENKKENTKNITNKKINKKQIKKNVNKKNIINKNIKFVNISRIIIKRVNIKKNINTKNNTKNKKKN